MGIRMNLPRLAIVGAVVVALIAALERVFAHGPSGTLLLTVSSWTAIAEGTIAIMAAAQIAHASWHRPILRRMLSVTGMIPFLGLLFLVFTTQMDIYPWADQSLRGDVYLPFHWMNREFFIARGVVMFTLVFVLARRFGTLALRDERGSRVWAVLYILAFVIHLTMVGFEWVMSLEKPWFSTLFGGWWVVGGFLSGICVGGVLLYGWRGRFDDGLRYAQKSIGGLMFGFSIFWAYFYFSQLIVIWYGNLPEEVMYLAKRIGYNTPYWWIARLIFGMVWFVPFFVLLGRKPKVTPVITVSMAYVILLGLYLEHWLMIQPVVPVNWALGIVELALMSFLFVSVMKSEDAVMPAQTAPAAQAGGLEPAGQH